MNRPASSGITDPLKGLNKTSSEDDGMVQYRPISNPATGEWIQLMPAPENNPDDVVRFHWRSMPGGMITEHIHPHQEEHFTITAGEAHFTVDGTPSVVKAGETSLSFPRQS